LDIFSIVSMLTFALTIFLAFKQPMVKIPFTSRYVKINYGMAPLIGVAILLATFTINLNTAAAGIVGSAQLKPWSIIIMIISLSYVCVSLDYTGFFEYASLKVARASKNSGRRLFIYFFLLTTVLTLFTDNDIVILTMTLIIFYVAKNAGMNPIPFLLVQFFTVNIFGIALYIGNPTNIIAADAYGLGFVEFAKWMLLPSLLAGVTCLIIFWLLFRRSIPRRIKPAKIEPSSALKNRRGAMFGFAMLALTIVFMSLPTNILGVPLWGIALFFAMVMLVHDVVSYRSKITTIYSRMPWEVVPFLIGLFIIVESLAATGWTELLGSQLALISGSTIAVVLGVCILSSLSAGVMCNHPMSIFFVRAMQSPAFAAAPQTARLGGTLALIAGSSFGANLTLIGSLAGIMWVKILADKGCSITFSQFSKRGFLIMPIVIFVTCLAIIAEIALMG
jgi:arsenical pump membrane protein